MRRIIAGAEISEQTVLLDVIERVGPGGDFLKERVTRERIRAGEHYYPSIASRLLVVVRGSHGGRRSGGEGRGDPDAKMPRRRRGGAWAP